VAREFLLSFLYADVREAVKIVRKPKKIREMENLIPGGALYNAYPITTI